MIEKPNHEALERRVRELEGLVAGLRTAEEALKDSEKRLAQIVHGSPIPTFVIDNNHTITHCNRAFENLKGVRADKIIGTHSDWLESSSEGTLMADFIIDNAPEVEMNWYYGGKCRKSAVIQGAYDAEAFFPNWGEKGKWLFVSAAPLKDAEGNIVGAIETIQDVSGRRRTEESLKESEKRLTQVVRGSSIPTFVIDKNHIITYCNRAFENLIGISTDKIVGTRNQWMAFYPSRRPVMADFMVDQLPAEKIYRYYGGNCRKSTVIEDAFEAEVFFPDVGKSGEWMFLTAAPLRDDDGHISGAIETLQNVTERRRAVEALRKSERRFRTLLEFVPYPLVVFDMDGRVLYLNPAFTEVFGWTFMELEGQRIDYVPPDREEETAGIIRRLLDEKVLLRYETRRRTRHGKILDVSISAALYAEEEDKPSGELVLLSDITQEKRLSRQNDAILRISMALPKYPDLEELLDYINSEVKRLSNSEGSIVVLRDEEKDELFIPGASFDDTATQKHVKEARFSMDQLIAGGVIMTGKPAIVNDTSGEPELHRARDERLGYRTRNLLVVPLKSSDRIIGALCAINKKTGEFEPADVEQLNIIGGTVALSVENARFSEEIKMAYREVSSMNRAKDKVINHLSHELKTPVSVLSGSMSILKRRLKTLPGKTWEPTLERMERNLERIVDIQYQAHDIMEFKQYRTHDLLSLMFDQCADELETLIAEEIGEGPVIEKVRKRIDRIFRPEVTVSTEVVLHDFVGERLGVLKTMFPHREVEILHRLEPSPIIRMPLDALQKLVDGLVKNAVENTPDEGKTEIMVRKKGDGTELVVHDFGVGITVENQARIFDGFFTTQDTMSYSSRRPFDFNAGGKGADLLRMKIFSERYNFKIEMTSSRCGFIPGETDTCPGRISKCPFCSGREDCYRSGETTFIITFPPAGKGLEEGIPEPSGPGIDRGIPEA
jgi:PAS domain S-box-containing protein